MKNKINKIINNIKIKIKSSLVIKIANLKNENKYLKKQKCDTKELEQEYIDKMNLMKIEIRQLKLELKKYEKKL